ncbi:MAG TPA: hypothetical protein VLA54_14245 [Acidimicrobiia bacterium]|nr:hypothetical protein [Acidimicrobiia bacterium]
MSISAHLSVSPDSRWNHVIVATAMSAGQAAGFDVGALGEISLAMSEVLADLDELAGVEEVRCDITSDRGAVEIALVGLGDEIDRMAEQHTQWISRLAHSAVSRDNDSVTYRLQFSRPDQSV